jgi:murein L,D-transpeptidase YcbB/YkuD
MNLNLRRLPITLLVIACAAGCFTAISAFTMQQRKPAPGLQLVINIAGNRMEVFEGGKLIQTFGVSVGMPGYETPPGEYKIHNVIWNPWWNPPDSKWAEGRKPEPPGAPLNPMGRVKLNFAPLLYIHGTYASLSLGRPTSRGCIRMRNDEVIELAQIVHRYGSPRVDPKVIQRLIENPKENQTIALARPVNVTVKYQIATVTDGFLIIYPDYYKRVGAKRAAQVETVLKQNGVPLAMVNRRRLDELIEQSVKTRVAISLDTLKAVDADPGVRGSR